MSEPRNRLDDIQESITEQSKDFVGDHALSSALVTFGLGVGVGLTVVSLLSDSGPPRRAAVAERLGAQLLDSLSAVVPDSFMKR
ncbi:hypothetical protein Pan258_45090 [Symmachiella dynata]|uniref:hypothetical protein n=1 Tax=Symmachiella dynata TaxID=2527995 RepID=UPI001189E420|nr:hypothetical protein [Symmachiella dynata]QDT50450.1 hypothetical protein Pan258_45090 [Symmachiella dynata]